MLSGAEQLPGEKEGNLSDSAHVLRQTFPPAAVLVATPFVKEPVNNSGVSIQQNAGEFSSSQLKRTQGVLPNIDGLRL